MMRVTTLIVCLLSLAASVEAQDRDTVFLHGLRSDPSQWEPTSTRLASELAIRPIRPALEWSQLFETQAANLERALGASLPADLVAVGHSNGGVVARQWVKSRDAGALVTLGSPNQGAPIVNHLYDWFRFLDDILLRITNVNFVFANRVDQDVWWWLPAHWLPRFGAAVDVWNIAGKGVLNLGFDLRFPVMPEMRVWSPFMDNLNSPSNLNSEAVRAPRRAAIVSAAKDFNHGGPFRVLAPGNYNDWRIGIFAAGLGLDGLASLIRLQADFDDLAAFDLADQISLVAEWFLEFEEVWCRTVSDPAPYQAGRCYEHDGIVPVWSQVYDYPRVPLVVMGDGPIHTREISDSGDQLLQALTIVAQVPRRIDPPPPGTPPPSVPPPPPSTGRYKITSGGCVWDPNDTGPDQCSPPPGRFKLDGHGGCYWDPNDYPPDQCAPPPAVTGRYKLDGVGGCYWDPNDGGPNQCVP
jgi:hypothetical protein